ncbi:MAG TPA: TolC family protein [Vicinamibacterales bacterium]|nr:TolC family protein [Vicinamibacterales bacterium]
MNNRAIVAVLGVLAFVSPAAAQTAGVRFPRSLVINEQALQAALQAAPRQAPGALPPPTSAGPRVALTVDEALKMALDHNLDISVQRVNQQTYDINLASLRAVYVPTLSTTVSTQTNVTQPTSTTAGLPPGSTTISASTNTFNGSLTQQVPWHGGSFLVNMNNNRQTTTSLSATVNPQYNSSWLAQYTQPILRNFSIDSNRNQLLITKINQDISDIQIAQLVTNTLANVRNAYWDYVFAIQSIEVAQQSLNLAEELIRNNQAKVEIGTLAPIEVVSSQTQAAAARQQLVTAQGTARTAEITLKRLIVSGTNDPLWTSTIDPVDRPDFSPAPIDVAAATARALATRSDVLQVKKNLQANNLSLEFLDNQTLPQADVVARYQSSGVGGTRFITTGNGVNREVLDVIPGGYGDALSTLFKQKQPNWTLSLNFSYPLGLTATRASIARAKILQNQIDVQLRQIDLAVASDVTNAAVAVQNATERVQAAQSALGFAQQQLDAENNKFAVGMSTNFQIVQVQRDLATAKNNELSAILAYRRALVEFERVQQTGNGGTITQIR